MDLGAAGPIVGSEAQGVILPRKVEGSRDSRSLSFALG